MDISLSLFPSPQLRCCGVFNATDWPRENPEVFLNNQNRPPQVGGCTSCTVGNDDENCMQFNGNFTYNGTVSPYSFMASRIVSLYTLFRDFFAHSTGEGGPFEVHTICESHHIMGIFYIIFVYKYVGMCRPPSRQSCAHRLSGRRFGCGLWNPRGKTV